MRSDGVELTWPTSLDADVVELQLSRITCRAPAEAGVGPATGSGCRIALPRHGEDGRAGTNSGSWLSGHSTMEGPISNDLQRPAPEPDGSDHSFPVLNAPDDGMRTASYLYAS